MLAQLIVLLIVFWIPPAFVIITNLLWDIKFWQTADFHRDRFYSSLDWDFQPSHRRSYVTALKVLLFLGAAILILPSPRFEIPLLAVLLSYVLWGAEALLNLERLTKGVFPYVRVTKRTAFIIFVSLGIVATIPTLFTIDLFSTTPAGLNPLTRFVTDVNIAGISFPPALYLYFVYGTLLALAFDLASPIVSSLAVYVTAPFSWLVKKIDVIKAQTMLQIHTNLLVIAISGSYGKTTTKQLLEHLLKDDFHTIATPVSETTAGGISRFVLNNLGLETQVLITDINAYREGDIDKMGKLLRPHIAIMTGVDESHIGLFGSLEETVEAKSEILTHLRAGGTAVMNIDDQHVADLAFKTQTKEILISSYAVPSTLDRSKNKLESDFYTISVREDGPDTNLIIKRKSSELIFPIPNYATDFKHSISAAVATAIELGVDPEKIAAKLEAFDRYHPDLELLDGDQRSHLIVSEDDTNVSTFKYLLRTLSQFPQGSRLLATTGLKGMGKHKRKMYAALKQEILNSVDVVISYDKDLTKMLGTADEGFMHVNHPDDMLYQIRSRIEPHDAVLIHGKIDRNIIERLRSEE